MLLRLLNTSKSKTFQILPKQYLSTAALKNKVVVVTGASSGIGEEISLAYAEKGANLVLSARRADKLQAVSEKCMLVGADSTVVVNCDVSKNEDCKNLIEQAIKTHGCIDILILNAGVGQVSSCFPFVHQ